MRASVKAIAWILGTNMVLAGTAVHADSKIKVNFPGRPIAPHSTQQCQTFESRVQATLKELYGARQRISDERARRALADSAIDPNFEGPGYHPAPNCDGGRTYNFRDEAAYDDAICYANTLMNDGFRECMREVSRTQTRTQDQVEGSLYQTAVLAYAQESVKTSIDVADKGPKVYRGDGTIAHWVAQASATKDYLDLAKDLRTLFDSNTPAQERLSAQSDLGLSVAQSMTENPLSQIFMATSLELIEAHYFKSMALLEAQMAAFDRVGKSAVVQPLDVRTLYDDEQLALIERTISALDRFADLGNNASNTYFGDEISYSARSSPTSNDNSSYVAEESSRSVQSAGSALGAAITGAAQAYIDAQAMRRTQEQVKDQQRPSGRPCWVTNGSYPGATSITGGWSTCGSSK